MRRCSKMGPYHGHSVNGPLRVRLRLHCGESIIIGAGVILAGNNCRVWKSNAQFLINESSVKASETNFDLKAYLVSNNCGKEKHVIVRLPVMSQNFPILYPNLEFSIPPTLSQGVLSGFPCGPSLGVPHNKT